MSRLNATAFFRKWVCDLMLMTFMLLDHAGHITLAFKVGSLASYRRGSFHRRKSFDLVRRLTTAGHENDCFDEAYIIVKGGSGGKGANTFKFARGRQHHSPTGGSGGDGGSVVLQADPNMNTLRAFRHHKSFAAKAGMAGDIEFANGAKGEDLFVHVPVGTLIFDNDTNTYLGGVSDVHSSVVVAKGGQGGKGNAHGLHTSHSQGNKAVGSPPKGGVKRKLRLQLKLVADIGLVGLPNAGKSTLLDALTNARPKIADYAFTTLVPNLGVCYVHNESCMFPSSSLSSMQYSQTSSEYSMILADIPGLIKDAHDGKGLGKTFLKHIERCVVILHIVSAVSPSCMSESDMSFDENVEAVVKDYLTINQELLRYSPCLAGKAQIVVLNKIDRLILSSGSVEEKIRDLQEKLHLLTSSLQKVVAHSRILAVSALMGRDEPSMRELIQRTWLFLNKVKEAS